MLRVKLAVSMIILLVSAGCVQNPQQPVSNLTHPTIQENAPSPIAKTTDNDNATHSEQLETDSLDSDNELSPIIISSINTGKSENSTIVPQTEPTLTQAKSSLTPLEATAQGKIDQALELCNYAQQMWEKGKIDEALNNLDSAYFSILEIEPDVPAEYIQQKEDIRYLISKRILEIYASREIVITGSHDEIPITLNDHVNKEIKRLTGPEKKFFIRSLERSSRYRPYITAELKKAGLPIELSWLPLIESGFKTRALSKARALGLWQFIPSTGYKFGLSRNYYIDERLDPEKSTQAAISYLKELHNLFGDWTTALAAYNCGEGRVLRTIRKQRINYLDNFWDLYSSLPRETARYVPRFLATLHIVNNLEKYNIKTSKPLYPVEYRTCQIKKQLRLKDIAKEIQVPYSELKDLNPELRYAILPPEQYNLKIPTEKADLFLSKIDSIKTTYSPPPMYVYHRVRNGETVSGIARKYRTTVGSICRVNNIKKSRIYAGKVLKIPSKSNKGYAKTTATKIPAGKTVYYKVRRGDSLWNIARKFGTTTKHIMQINKLASTQLSVGQRLVLSSDKAASTANKATQIYKVRSGDSPFKIAQKHNMTLTRLLSLNQLSKRSKIYPGQRLIVE